MVSPMFLRALIGGGRQGAAGGDSSSAEGKQDRPAIWSMLETAPTAQPRCAWGGLSWRASPCRSRASAKILPLVEREEAAEDGEPNSPASTTTTRTRSAARAGRQISGAKARPLTLERMQRSVNDAVLADFFHALPGGTALTDAPPENGGTAGAGLRRSDAARFASQTS